MKTSFIARVSQDAKVTTLENGNTVINFSVAINERHKNKAGEWVSKVEFVSCSYWKNNSKVADYLKKGMPVHLEGNIEARSYPDKKKKKQVAYLQLTAKYIQLLAAKPATPNDNGSKLPEEAPF